MDRVNANDVETVLVRSCAKLHTLLAGYAADCAIVEAAQCGAGDARDVGGTRLRQRTMAKRWRCVLRRLTRVPAGTMRGAFAKNRAIQACFEHHLAEDADVMALVVSHTSDLDALLAGECEGSLHPPVPTVRLNTLAASGPGRRRIRDKRPGPGNKSKHPTP